MDATPDWPKLSCWYLQRATVPAIIELAVLAGAEGGIGAFGPRAQSALLACISAPLSHGLDAKYREAVLRAAALAAESAGHELHDGLADALAALLMRPDPSAIDGMPGTAVKVYSYRTSPDGPRMQLSLSVSLNLLAGSTGCADWEAGFSLAELILSQPAWVRGKRVVELGAGTGATGIVLARLPPGDAPSALILTDGSAAALANLRANLARNGVVIESGPGGDADSTRVSAAVAGKLQCRCLQWDVATAGDLAAMRADVVLAADVLYDPGSIPGLVRVFSALLRRGATDSSPGAATAVVATTRRNESTLESFVAACGAAGLVATELPWAAPPAFVHHASLDRSRIRTHVLTLT